MSSPSFLPQISQITRIRHAANAEKSIRSLAVTETKNRAEAWRRDFGLTPLNL